MQVKVDRCSNNTLRCTPIGKYTYISSFYIKFDHESYRQASIEIRDYLEYFYKIKRSNIRIL